METIKKILDYFDENGFYRSEFIEYHIGCGECEVAYANTKPTKHWEHYGDNLRALPDSIPNYVEQLFNLSEKMLHAGVTDWAIEVRAIANLLAEALDLD